MHGLLTYPDNSCSTCFECNMANFLFIDLICILKCICIFVPLFLSNFDLAQVFKLQWFPLPILTWCKASPCDGRWAFFKVNMGHKNKLSGIMECELWCKNRMNTNDEIGIMWSKPLHWWRLKTATQKKEQTKWVFSLSPIVLCRLWVRLDLVTLHWTDYTFSPFFAGFLSVWREKSTYSKNVINSRTTFWSEKSYWYLKF